MDIMSILLVDDHILFRKGIASLISSRQGLKIVGEAEDGIEGVKLARETRPDVILMDVHMPNLDGLEAVKILTEEMPNVAVVMLTIDDDDDSLFQAVKNGAKGYLLKNLEPQELYRMLDKLRLGEAAISSVMAAKILRELMDPPSSEAKQHKGVDELNVREIRVLEEVVKGVNNKKIGDTLGITEDSVKGYLRTILAKLHLRNRTQAAVHAVRKGLVNNSPVLYQ
jgi:DNA-binding NarL/FixJ family response regulator